MSQRLEIFRSLLSAMRPGKLLDLATGHGAFAMAAEDLGWKVTAVDVRDRRFPRDRPRIRWLVDDVRNFPTDGYDCIALLGLLYHLELPAQLDLLKRCAGTPTILDTHVALSPQVTEGAYEGLHFDEVAGRTEEDWRVSGTASWGNEESFWATEKSLRRMLRDCGYQHIWTYTPWYEPDRTFWLCLGPPAAGGARGRRWFSRRGA